MPGFGGRAVPFKPLPPLEARSVRSLTKRKVLLLRDLIAVHLTFAMSLVVLEDQSSLEPSAPANASKRRAPPATSKISTDCSLTNRPLLASLRTVLR